MSEKGMSKYWIPASPRKACPLPARPLASARLKPIDLHTSMWVRWARAGFSLLAILSPVVSPVFGSNLAQLGDNVCLHLL